MSSAGLSIGELVGTVSLNDQFSGPINNVAKALGLSSESFKAITGFAGLAAGAVVGATSAIVALGIHGSDVADVSDAFDQLTSAAGSTSEAMLGALQEGTLGTISNFDLMKAANGVLGSGMVKTSDDMKTLAASAKLLADRTGGETAQAFDTLTSAMASGKTAGIKQLGVFVDSDVAVQNYARSVHKSVGDLTDHEVATAKSQAILAALKKQLEANGPATSDFADNINQGKVAVSNFTDGLAMAIARSPVVAAGMKSVGDSFRAAFGNTQQDAVKTLMGFVNNFAIGLTYAGQIAVTAATVFVTAWSAIKTVILGVITAIALQGTAIVTMVSGLASMAEKIPGAGKLVEGFAAGARDLAGSLQQVTAGLAAQTVEAAKGVVGNSDLHRTLDGLNGAFILARDKMEAAKDAAVDLGNGLPKTKIKDLGEEVSFTDAQFKMFADSVRAGQAAVLEMADGATSRFATLQDDLTVANMTGTQARLFEIQQAQAAEMLGIQSLAEFYPAAYEVLTEMVTEKYRLMTDAATGHFATVQQAAEAAGFSTRDQLEAQAATAQETYERMKNSGLFSINAVKKAHEDAKRAEAAIDSTVFLTKMQQFDLIANTAKTFISTVFGKGKIAAIATAIIDTAQAVVKALASAPPPLNYALAAAVGVAGLVQINKIRSTDIGFATGTPGTSLVDFGQGTPVTLHHEEAVVTRAQSESVAGMVAGALARQDQRTVSELRALRSQMDFRDQMLPRLIRDAMQQAIA